MLKRLHQPRAGRSGFTLIELLVTLTILGVTLAMAVPAVGTWINDSRVRSTAEALQNALRLAQGTAVQRSRVTVFALTAAQPSWNAVPAANARNWFIRVLPMPTSDETASANDLIQSSSVGTESGVTITGPALLCFNTLGQQTTRSNTVTGMTVGCAADDAATYTVARAGASRSLDVRVNLGGRVRMCDPAKTLSTTNPDGC